MAAPAAASVAAILTAVALWYVSNVAILITNKVLLQPDGFRRPVTLTLGHTLTCTLMGGLGAYFKILPWQPLQSLRQVTNVVCLSFVFCLTIVAANASLKDVPVSFTQAIGSSTPFFTAVFAFLFQGKRESRLTYATLVPVVLGVVISSKSEPIFHAVGFSLCLAAAGGRALKSVMQSMLMSNPSEQLNPHSLLFYMSASCAVMLIPASLLLEPGAIYWAQHLATTRPGFSWWLLSNLVLSYGVNYSNFLVTKLTSALTLQVLGNAKGVVATVVSVCIFRNTITWRFVLGYSIVLTGVYLYSDSKNRYSAAAAAITADDTADSTRLPLLDGDGRDNGGDGTVVISASDTVLTKLGKGVDAGKVLASEGGGRNGAGKHISDMV